MKLTPKQSYERYLANKPLSSKQLEMALDWYVKTNPYKEFRESCRKDSLDRLKNAIEIQKECEEMECIHFAQPHKKIESI